MHVDVIEFDRQAQIGSGESPDLLRQVEFGQCHIVLRGHQRSERDVKERAVCPVDPVSDLRLTAIGRTFLP